MPDGQLPERKGEAVTGGPDTREAAGAGAEPRSLDYNETTVSYGNDCQTEPRRTLDPATEAVSTALQPFRLELAQALERKAKLKLDRAVQAWGARKALELGPGLWERQRARSLREQVADKQRWCQSRVVELVDNATGEVTARRIGCGQALCPRCRRKRAGRVGRRVREQLAGINAAFAATKKRPMLMTLTVRDSGAPGLDAMTLRAAWPGLRASFRHRYGYSPGFIRYEEITAGRGGQGHVHWHALVWMHNPGRETLANLQRWWRLALSNACDTLGRDHVDGNVDMMKPRGGAETAAAYAGKLYAYIVKESHELCDLEPETAADYLAGVYNRRRFTTSRFLLAKVEGPQLFTVLCIRWATPGDPGEPWVGPVRETGPPQPVVGGADF